MYYMIMFTSAKNRWTIFLLVLATFVTLLTIRVYVNHHITGDEPHYLLMDYSLIHDHDFNLKNNYQNQDVQKFYPNLTADRQVGAGQGYDNSNRWYSIHGIGMPLLLAPGFLLVEMNGAVVTMVIVATLVVWLTAVWTFEVTKNRRLSYITGGALLVCYSFNGLAGYLYPDTVIAAITLAGLIVIQRYYKRILFQVLFGFGLGFLLLIHFKTLGLIAPLLLALSYKLWSKEHRLPLATFAVLVPFTVYFFVSNHGWFGVWNPTEIYSALGLPESSPPYITSAFLFDSMRGFLVYNPITLLIFVGLPLWYKQNRESFFIAMLVSVPSIIAVLTFDGWNGGASHIGRYAIDFLPVLLPAVAFAVGAAKKKWEKAAVGLIFFGSLFITVVCTLLKPPYIYKEVRSLFFIRMEDFTGIAFDKVLPQFSETTTLTGKLDGIKIAFGYSIIALCLIYGFILSKRVKPKRASKVG